MKKLNKICINCPAGCHLEIIVDGSAITVKGNRCVRGKKYAETELSDPRRTVTSAVLTSEKVRRCIPVKSSAPIPIKKIPELLDKLRSVRLLPPVKRGAVVIKNFADTDVDIITTGE